MASDPKDPRSVSGDAPTEPISDEQRALAEVPALRLFDGEVIGGRYRVLRYLASGGMGEVYEAEDQELGERVALKTIRAENHDRVAEDRFKREIQLSRKVTHPNVCRIFDVGYHVRSDGERVVFLSMELLVGETLLQRIRRQGPVALPEAGSLLRQISAGLGAAHAAGVVHRDLKSANVILVPRKVGGLRAVVTDFGLAHVSGPQDRSRSLSGSGGIVGTPGYMAPEQVEGNALSPRTDIYALGIVMYEMLTAQLPFEGTTPLSIAAKRLTTAAPSPKKLRPDLPARWEKTVLACMERDPAARPASARAVAEMVGLITDSYEEIDGTVRVERASRPMPLVPALLAFLLLVIGLVGVQRWRDRPQAGARRAIAALPFHPSDALTAEQSWIGECAAELISIRLGEGQTLQSFELSTVTAALRDLGLKPGAELQPAELDRLRAQLTIDLVASGRYHIAPEDGALVIEAELQDAHARRSLAKITERGRPEELTVLIGRVADGIARAAGVSPNDGDRGLGVTLPRRPEALRAFVDARALYDRREVAEAVASVQRGIIEEPDHARSHLLLAEADAELGDEHRAAIEAKAAAGLAAGLPRRERIFIEAAAGALAHDRPAAIAGYEVLHNEMPTDLDVGWRLVEQLDLTGRASDALKIIEQLRSERVPPILALRIDLLEVDAREALGDLDRALEISRRAAGQADGLGARLARANARYKECRVLYVQHRLDEARVACEAAKRSAGEAGNRRLRAAAVNAIAGVDFSAAKLDAARRGYEEILPLFRELGDRGGESTALSNLGSVLDEDLDQAGAIKLWQAALALAGEFEDPISSAPTEENLSAAYQDDLDWTQALGYAEKALAVWRGADQPDALMGAICHLAELHLDMGRGPDAERALQELEVLQARLTTAPRSQFACDGVKAAIERGRGRPERALFILRTEAEELRKSHEDIDRVDLGYELARVQAEVGDRGAAVATLDEMTNHPTSKRSQAVARSAAALRLRLQAELGVGPRVIAPLVQIEEQVKGETRRRVALGTAIELARTRAALGDRPGALRRLHAVAERAQVAGAISLALEAQLAEAELAAEGGHPPTHVFVTDYGQRARSAGRPGWADRVDRLAARTRPHR